MPKSFIVVTLYLSCQKLLPIKYPDNIKKIHTPTQAGVYIKKGLYCGDAKEKCSTKTHKTAIPFKKFIC